MTGCFGRSPFGRKKKNKKKDQKDNQDEAVSPSKQEKIELLTSSQNASDECSPEKEEHSFHRSNGVEVKLPLLSDCQLQQADTTVTICSGQLNSTSYSFLEDSSLISKDVRSLDTIATSSVEPLQKVNKSTSITSLNNVVTPLVDVGCQYDLLPADKYDSKERSGDEPSSFTCHFGCQFDQKMFLGERDSKPAKGDQLNGVINSVDFDCQVKVVNNINNDAGVFSPVTLAEGSPSVVAKPHPSFDVLSTSTESSSPSTLAERKRAALLSIVKKTNAKIPKFCVENVVSEEGELLNAAAVRKLLQKPSVKSYTSFMICLKKGSAKFVEQILQESDVLQLMFNALDALSMKCIGSFTDTILQLAIVRALKFILNSSVGIVYLINEDRGFVSDLAYGKNTFYTFVVFFSF